MPKQTKRLLSRLMGSRNFMVNKCRAGLEYIASFGSLRRVMQICERELSRAIDTNVPVVQEPTQEVLDVSYDGTYFGVDRDPLGDREGKSGYASYDRVSSNADIAAWLIWRNFRVEKTLDLGCAKGYLVEALRDLGVESFGCDISRFAIENASESVSRYLRLGSLSDGLPYEDEEFDLVSALEILEHLAPDQISDALLEIKRVCKSVVYATIPSFGYNASGPDGHFDGKVRPDRLDHYRSLGSSYVGPIDRDDLAVDSDGKLIEGHLCIAAFEWWQEQFTNAGFERRIDVEQRLYRDIEPAGLAPFWNLYVFIRHDVDESILQARSPKKSLRDLGLNHPLIEHNFVDKS